MSESATSARKVQARQRAEQIIQLRIAGVRVTAIAAQIGVSRQWVRKVLHKYLDATGRRIEADAKRALVLEVDRLDSSLRIAHAIAHNREKPDEVRLKAIDRLLAVADRRARLLGLNAPEKIAPVNPDGATPYTGITDEQRAAKIAELLARAAKQSPPEQSQP